MFSLHPPSCRDLRVRRARKKHVGSFLSFAPAGYWIEVRGRSPATVQAGPIVTVRDHWDIDDWIRQITGDRSRSVEPIDR